MSYTGVSAPMGAMDDGRNGLRPIPDQEDRLTKPFWDAVNRGELVIQRCESCKTWYQPPVGMCRKCLTAERLDFIAVSGNGRVYSFSIVERQRLAAFDELTPFVVASVELDDAPGVFLLTNLPGVPPDAVRSGTLVAVKFEEIAPGIKIPQFVPRQP